MHCDPEQLTALALGWSTTEISDAGWRALRLPPALRDIYQPAEASRLRMQCTAGVRLRFRSDARQLRVRWRCEDPVRQHYQGTLVLDDNPARALPVGSLEGPGEWAGTLAVSAAPGVHGFDLWLPHLCRCDVLGLELVDATLLEPARPARRWLAYGDSITQGMSAPLPHEAGVMRVAQAAGLDLLNLGVGGAKCDPRLAEIGAPAGPWDLISIAYGTNDFMVVLDPQAYAGHLRALLQRLRAQFPTTPLLVIPAPPATLPRFTEPNGQGHRLADFQQAAAQAARSVTGTTVIAPEQLLEPAAGNFNDGVHPNAVGFAQYARSVLAHLPAALRVS